MVGLARRVGERCLDVIGLEVGKVTQDLNQSSFHIARSRSRKPPPRIARWNRASTTNPAIFGGKPIIRGHRLAVEHVLGMLAAGDTAEIILKGYAWLEPDDIRACLVYARRLVGHERVEPALNER